MKRWIVVGACIVVLALMVTMAGCPPAEEAGDYELSLDVDTYQDLEAAEAPGEFEWTEEPTVEMIPAGPVVGMLNGEPFEAELIRLRKSEENTYQLELLNKAPENGDPTGIVTGEDAWQLRFTHPEGETGTLQWSIDEQKDFQQEHVYYWYAQGEGQGPMSVNYPWGAALEITEWTIEGSDDNDRILGTVTGRVAIVMRDDEHSWAAGEFEAVYFEW